MAYSKFIDLTKVADQFKLKIVERLLFPECQPIAPSEWLKTTLALAEKFGFLNEKERSERLVNPILFEFGHLNQHRITIYSGRELNVDIPNGLNGECDFLLALDTPHSILQAPLFSVVEAKKQDMEYGMAQCTAQMLGAQLFNQNKQNAIRKIYGAVTTGLQWKFMSLEGSNLTIDTQDIFLNEPGRLLGFMQCIFDEFKRENNIA